MRQTRFWCRFASGMDELRSMIFAALVAAVPMYSWAYSTPQVDALMDEQLSVRELMRLETELALRMARDRMNATSAGAVPQREVRTMTQPPRLSAIYGVGTALMAEVALDDQTFLYRKGQALPVGTAPGSSIYLLAGISTSCVELKRPDSSHRLCLEPTQWVGK